MEGNNMSHLSLGKFFLLTAVTFGLYPLFWFARTKDEMNRLGADVPGAWMLFIPLANLFFLWKYAAGAEHVTGGDTSQVGAFALLLVLGPIGMMMLQAKYNATGGGGSGMSMAAA
jgi:hypothetical protein